MNHKLKAKEINDYFGCYVLLDDDIPLRPNESRWWKVIQMLNSNIWLDIPPLGGSPGEFSVHDHFEIVVDIATCGEEINRLLRIDLSHVLEMRENDNKTRVDLAELMRVGSL